MNMQLKSEDISTDVFCKIGILSTSRFTVEERTNVKLQKLASLYKQNLQIFRSKFIFM